MHFHVELINLRKRILAEAALVEEALDKALTAFTTRDERLATSVIEGDRRIDAMEIEVEEECLKILALHHPVAGDLRFIVTVLKMNNDLERMGDVTVSIARRAAFLAKRDPVMEMPAEFAEMTRAVREMLKGSLDALVNGDEALAIRTCQADDHVDALKRTIAGTIRERMQANPEHIRTLMKMSDVTRHLERIADLATNIAEDVIYLVRGEIVRHKEKE